MASKQVKKKEEEKTLKGGIKSIRRSISQTFLCIVNKSMDKDAPPLVRVLTALITLWTVLRKEAALHPLRSKDSYGDSRFIEADFYKR